MVKISLDEGCPPVFMAKLRTLGIHFMCKGTAARPNEVRVKLVRATAPCKSCILGNCTMCARSGQIEL